RAAESPVYPPPMTMTSVRRSPSSGGRRSAGTSTHGLISRYGNVRVIVTSSAPPVLVPAQEKYSPRTPSARQPPFRHERRALAREGADRPSGYDVSGENVALCEPSRAASAWSRRRGRGITARA